MLCCVVLCCVVLCCGCGVFAGCTQSVVSRFALQSLLDGSPLHTHYLLAVQHPQLIQRSLQHALTQLATHYHAALAQGQVPQGMDARWAVVCCFVCVCVCRVVVLWCCAVIYI
jgi:hypothetical protein